jgi:N-glycosylase/DNA lyase
VAAPARLRLERPPGARLASIVRSHGWSSLAPFLVEERPLVLRGALPPTGEAGAVSYALRDAASCIDATVTLAGRATPRRLSVIGARLRELLSLDEALGPLYTRTDGHPRLGYARRVGAGRMLRGASVWEDLVKVLLTTNCSWALTTQMTARLVQALGDEAPGGARAFPTPARMAAEDERFYRDVVRAGYRAPHLVQLSRAVASGALALPARARAREHEIAASSDEAVRGQLLALPGFGPFAADNLLRLLGR